MRMVSEGVDDGGFGDGRRKGGKGGRDCRPGYAALADLRLWPTRPS